MPSSEHTKGAWYVGLAYTLWGFFPIYWKALAGISSLQLICHRIVWSFLLLLVMVGRSKEWSALWHAIRAPRVLGVYTVAAVAIAVNWLIFVWAVGINQIVQISLGYFINPLLSVVLGMAGLSRTVAQTAMGIGRVGGGGGAVSHVCAAARCRGSRCRLRRPSRPTAS